jgi:nicotinate phosphoribosyltransferase
MTIKSGLLTDLYELTMMQGYYHYDLNPRVVFDMFFRRQPFHGGFSVFAGLDDLLTVLENLHFSEDDLEYLDSLGMFHQDFLDELKNFRFRGDIWAMDEGTAVFPHEPLIRVHASLMEAQLIESVLLNIINFQTLVATKTARIYLAANHGKVAEFGLRRAQGVDGAISASRAAYIGGAAATSNVYAGKRFNIPVTGTMAHSWVMAFDDEREAFDKFAELYPDAAILLIDTYDTLDSGIPNAVEIGKRLKEKGKPFGVRLDSGDIQYLSIQVRKALDAAGLTDATIAASNELNEDIIHQLVAAGTPIDLWGVGTHLVTGGSEASFSGVYKLAAKEVNGVFQPTMKVSDNPEKSTNPGIKQVYRFLHEEGNPLADLITFDGDGIDADHTYNFHHPYVDYRHFRMRPHGPVIPLLKKYMENGTVVGRRPSLAEIQAHARRNLDSLDQTYRRIINPHIYKVSISDSVKNTKGEMLEKYLGNHKEEP